MRKSANIDQSKVNADLRARFGDTATRQELLAYRAETGIDPKWIRRNAACRVGRANYRIPGDGESTPVPNAMTFAAPVRKTRGKAAGRAVIPTPFDDDVFDDAPKASPEPDFDAAETSRELATPSLNDGKRLVYVRALVCKRSGCPGRRPAEFYDGVSDKPTCECGSEMQPHSWARKIAR